MATEIIVALITGGITLIGSILAFRTSSKQIQLKQKEIQESQFKEFKSEINSKLDNHKKEYLNGIENVKQGLNSLSDEVTDLRATYQEAISLIECKIDNLEKKQDKHNSVIERTYKLEADVAILKERTK